MRACVRVSEQANEFYCCFTKEWAAANDDDDELRFYVPFNSISVMSGRWKG